MAVEGVTRCIKYLLFVFNLLFLLAGLALVIIGAVAAAKLTPYSTVAGVHFNGVGVFIIVIGVIVFIISFFGCLGAYKENYCLLILFIIFMIISLLALVAAIITAFVMRNKVESLFTEAFSSTIAQYNQNDTNHWATKFWNDLQEEFHCCGSQSPKNWTENPTLNMTKSVPDSCCKVKPAITGCGKYQLNGNWSTIYNEGCASKLNAFIFNNVVAVGGAAAAIAVLQFIGILLASCLANGLRKEYSTV